MPGYKTHLSAGFLTFVFLMPVRALLIAPPTLPELLIFLGCSLVGSIFPDIDIKSKMQKLFYSGATCAVFASLLSGSLTIFFAISFCALLVGMLRHRTITHRIWFLVAIPGIITLSVIQLKTLEFNLAISIYFFFVGGAVSHVFLDRTQTFFKKLFKI